MTCINYLAVKPYDFGVPAIFAWYLQLMNSWLNKIKGENPTKKRRLNGS